MVTITTLGGGEFCSMISIACFTPMTGISTSSSTTSGLGFSARTTASRPFSASPRRPLSLRLRRASPLCLAEHGVIGGQQHPDPSACRLTLPCSEAGGNPVIFKDPTTARCVNEFCRQCSSLPAAHEHNPQRNDPCARRSPTVYFTVLHTPAC